MRISKGIFVFVSCVSLLSFFTGMQPTCLAQMVSPPAGVWHVGSVSPSRSSNTVTPPGGLLFQFQGGLPISVTENDITVRSATSGIIPGLFTQQVVGSYTHTFKPTNAFQVDDTIFVTISGNISDVVGNFLDGNGNDIAEGSPDDDLNYWFTIGEINPVRNAPLARNLSVSVSPLPAKDEVHIKLSTENYAECKVQVFDSRGKLVNTVFHGNLPSGTNTLTWQVIGLSAPIPAGMYFISVTSGRQTKVARAIVL